MRIAARQGLLRLGRKSGAVVRRDAGSEPPDPGWAQDWTSRLRTLLAWLIIAGTVAAPAGLAVIGAAAAPARSYRVGSLTTRSKPLAEGAALARARNRT